MKIVRQRAGPERVHHKSHGIIISPLRGLEIHFECVYRQKMKLTQKDINTLSKHLFWDVDEEDLNWDQHTQFIIKRILEYGTWSDFKLLKNKLTVQGVADAAKKMRSLDEVTLHFVAAISDTDVKEYRCYTSKQSQKNYIDF